MSKKTKKPTDHGITPPITRYRNMKLGRLDCAIILRGETKKIEVNMPPVIDPEHHGIKMASVIYWALTQDDVTEELIAKFNEAFKKGGDAS